MSERVVDPMASTIDSNARMKLRIRQELQEATIYQPSKPNLSYTPERAEIMTIVGEIIDISLSDCFIRRPNAT
ncbi:MULTISPECIES: hypothetical protein [unclassified Thioalkalivibrio]|uniref:hypothetical protein n=1 Tax=unclassified Thioalkalivibrio TaxID=2621013 RepID=UPI0012DCBD7C|nr:MULTISPECIES: hypothetical protein [unclassified Thioalkalivibrio]